MKRHVFHLCHYFATLRIDNIIHLANILYNRRVHRSIGTRPLIAHFCTHAAHVIKKMNDCQYRHHQLSSMTEYVKKTARDRIKIGSRVKVQKLRSIFRKFQPLSNSFWSDSVHTVTKIDTTKFPYIYHVSDLRKRFYSFQLLLVSQYFPITERTSFDSKILVKDCKQPNRYELRSGHRSKDLNGDVTYNILKNNELLSVDRNKLLQFKSAYGSDVLAYSSFFSHPDHLQFIV